MRYYGNKFIKVRLLVCCHTTFTSRDHLKFHTRKYSETSTAKAVLSYGRYSVVGVFKNDSKQIFGTILIIVIIIITDQILYSFMVEVEILVDSFILFHYELVKDESPQKKKFFSLTQSIELYIISLPEFIWLQRTGQMYLSTWKNTP